MSKNKIEVNMNVYDIPILIEELEKAQDTIKKLQQEKQQLENNRDKAIEYVESHFIFSDKTGECYQTHTFDKDNVKKLYDILKGGSDE